MSKGLAILAVLASSNVAAFVVPLRPRAILFNPAPEASVAARAQPSRSDGEALNMRYVAMNRFKVKLGSEDEFETMWRERESKLDSFSGFEQFMLLRLDTKKAENNEQEGEVVASRGYTEFVSHTIWAHQMDFEEWKRSQSFKKSHGGGGGGEGGAKGEGAKARPPGAPGGMSKIGEMIVEPPTPSLYHAAIIEPVPPEHQGGLWEFEDEPSYFDGDM